MSGETLGLIAGEGALPRLIAETRARRGGPCFVVAFEGAAPDWIAAHPHAVLPFEKPGALFRALREAGVGSVAFAGAMRRPRLNPLRFDAAAVRLAPSLLPLLKGGDDALLRALAAVFEREGFRVIGPHAALEGDGAGGLAPAGAFSAARPDAAALRDVERAAEIAAALGAQDVGQGAVVAGGLCLGLETLQGTDAMLAFVARTRPAGERGGALYKAPKPGQDRRLDLPAIGPDTLRAAAAAGLAGVAVEAEGALLIEPEALRAEADRLGLFLWGRRPGSS